MTSRTRDSDVITPHVTSSDATTSGYQIRRNERVEAPVDLTLDDGSVVVPAAVAGDVLRALVRDLTARVRADGGELAADVRRLLYALHDAEQRAARRAAPARIEHSSDNDTAPPPPATVAEVSVTEAAALLGCSTGYVRRLARTDAVRARRIGARAWAVDRAALDDYRHGRGATTV